MRSPRTWLGCTAVVAAMGLAGAGCSGGSNVPNAAGSTSASGATRASASSAPRGSAQSSAPALPPEVVLRWSVSQGLWGTEVFEVRRDGRGHYAFQPVSPAGSARAFDVAVPAASLAAIDERATRTGFCNESSSRPGIPDEGKPTLALALDGASCAVSLWDGEWRDRPGPKEISGLVQALHASPAKP